MGAAEKLVSQIKSEDRAWLSPDCSPGTPQV